MALRCLKRYKLPLCDLITVYCGYIRPILDYGVPVFNGSLTVMNCCSLETIQKRACRIMLGDAYITYKIALEKCTLVTLKDRRKKICTDFASSLESNPQCQEWLPLTQSTHYSLRKRAKYQQFQCKTKRFQNSALPYLISLLNEKDLNPWVYFHVIFFCYTHNIINVFNCSWKLWLVLCFTNGVCCNDQLIIKEPLS